MPRHHGLVAWPHTGKGVLALLRSAARRLVCTEYCIVYLGSGMVITSKHLRLRNESVFVKGSKGR